MTDFSDIQTRISLLTNNHIGSADIKALINRVHQEEVESHEWHYRQKRFNLATTALKNTGTVSVANGATKVFGTDTNFENSDVGRHIRLGETSGVIAIEIDDVRLFPDALNFQEYVVTNADVTTIATSFSGAQATQAEFTVLQDNIRYTIDGTTPTPTVGQQVLVGNIFTISGHTNLDNFQMIAETSSANVSVTSSRTTQELVLKHAWPGSTLTDAEYEMFTKYYALPADVDTVLRVVQSEISLKEWTPFEIDMYDPDRCERSDHPTYWARAGENSSGQKLIELWPVSTVAQHISVEYLAGHTDMVNNSDRPLVPPSVLENKAMLDACAIMFAKQGDSRWLQLSSKFEARYAHALERIARQDSTRFGRLEQVLDLDGMGYGRRGAFDYSYIVDHDV